MGFFKGFKKKIKMFKEKVKDFASDVKEEVNEFAADAKQEIKELPSHVKDVAKEAEALVDKTIDYGTKKIEKIQEGAKYIDAVADAVKPLVCSHQPGEVSGPDVACQMKAYAASLYLVGGFLAD